MANNYRGSLEAGGFGPLPFYAIEVANRIRRIEIPKYGRVTDGKELVKMGLIAGWQCGENGEVSPFATFAVRESIQPSGRIP